MLDGFTFCGFDIADIGLSYAPEMSDTYVYAPAESSYHEESYEGHNGGYFYGANRKPKEFVLRCYFQNRRIDDGIMERVHALFRVGKSGKLVFARRPWCFYYATVISCVPEYTNYMNGTIKITMKAYYPYARSDSFVCKRTEPYYEKIMQSTAFFNKDEMVLQTSFSAVDGLALSAPQTKSIILANPGTERADVGIAIAGNVEDGVIISNRTTGQNIKFVAMSKATTTDQNKYVFVDGISGKTIITGGGESTISFLYHDSGFLNLDPSYPALREVYVNYAENSNIISIKTMLYQNVIGKYIFLDKWRKIVEQIDKNTYRISTRCEASGTLNSTIMSMNELYIQPISAIDLTKLDFIYKPTFA